MPALTASNGVDLWLLSGPADLLAGTQRDGAALALAAHPAIAGQDETI
jgi:hypothetical protein